MIREALAKLVEYKELTEEEAYTVAKEILSGEATPSQIAAYLTALRMKGETVDEVVGMAKAMLEYAVKISPEVPPDKLIDTCGTGGDGKGTINVSTAAGLVAAGAGVYVAKHGNRAVSGRCGSADVLRMLGVNVQASPEVVKRCIERVGMGFMLAPIFHPAMRNVAGIRSELGVRTVFNMLGPLTNPARVRAQLVGVFSEEAMELVAHSLKRLGVGRALVVHGSGLDEISITGPTRVFEITREGEVRGYVLRPEDFGLRRFSLEELRVSSVDDSAEKLFLLLYSPEDVGEAIREFVVLNTAGALVVSGIVEDFGDGVEVAREVLYSGKAYDKLVMLVKESGGDLSKLEHLEGKYG